MEERGREPSKSFPEPQVGAVKILDVIHCNISSVFAFILHSARLQLNAANM